MKVTLDHKEIEDAVRHYIRDVHGYIVEGDVNAIEWLTDPTIIPPAPKVTVLVKKINRDSR